MPRKGSGDDCGGVVTTGGGKTDRRSLRCSVITRNVSHIRLASGFGKDCLRNNFGGKQCPPRQGWVEILRTHWHLNGKGSKKY